MTRAAWSSVLITVVLLVTLSWAGTRWLTPGDPAAPAATAPAPPPRVSTGKALAATAWTAVRRGSRGIGARVVATGPEERRMALVALLGVASLGILLRGLGVAARKRKDRRPTPATNLGRWTRRTGLARDAARFLMIRHQRQDLPNRGAAGIIRGGQRRG